MSSFLPLGFKVNDNLNQGDMQIWIGQGGMQAWISGELSFEWICFNRFSFGLQTSCDQVSLSEMAGDMFSGFERVVMALVQS